MEPLDYPFDAGLILQKKRRLRRQLLEQPGLIQKKVAVLSGSTVGEVVPVLELFLLNEGIQPVFHEGGYGLWYEELAFGEALAAFAPEILYVHTTVRNLQNLPCPADSPAAAEEKFRAELARWQSAWQAAAALGCTVIFNNFELPDTRVLGNLAGTDVRGTVRFVRRMNEALAQFAEKTPHFYVNDINWLAASVGLDRWHSPQMWYAYKYALDTECIPALCHSLACIIKSLLGKNKKALALDLDNTLWGGVIGDDGPEGIRLGEEDPAGRAHTDLQKYLRDLAGEGVLLNVCSKNEEALAKEGFSRADSVLKAEDFICFKANWEPKHQNIAAMAAELNLLPESFVFLDDNPAERALVRRELPGVAVPELAGPETFVRTLDRAGYFEATALSADDRKRGEMYKENARRAAAQSAFGSYEDYLKSLEMQAEIGPFTPAHLERITQLINKTNQFNLTTRRYTQAEVAAIAADPAYLTLYGRLADKFGDNGIVTALIGKKDGTELEIELWIMSCRVFKRDFEKAMFDQLAAACAKMGVTAIRGTYRPTAKNLFVKDFYDTMGFVKIAEQDGVKQYRYQVPAQPQPLCGVIAVKTV